MDRAALYRMSEGAECATTDIGEARAVGEDIEVAVAEERVMGFLCGLVVGALVMACLILV